MLFRSDSRKARAKERETSNNRVSGRFKDIGHAEENIASVNAPSGMKCAKNIA